MGKAPNKEVYKKLNNYSRHRGGLEAYLDRILGEKFKEYRSMWKKVINCEVLTDFPYFVVLETQFQCNFKCRMCHKSDGDMINEIYYPEVLSMELFKRTIDECAEYNCPSISLNNNNEPLLDKLIINRLSYASKKSIIDIMMNTNGLLLSEEISKALIDNGLTRLLISLDAASEGTYSIIRSNHYKKVVYNIERFLAIREKKKSTLPALRLSFCIININEAEQEKFLDMWKDKADEVTFQTYTPPNSSDSFIKLYPVGRSETIFSCSQPFERAIIRGNGNVYPCCYQAMKLPVGNIKDSSLYEIWHNNKFSEYRRIVLEKDWPANHYCLQCSELR